MVAHVGDFGLAKFLYDQPIGTAPRTHLSISIAIKGTVGYVAPGNSLMRYIHLDLYNIRLLDTNLIYHCVSFRVWYGQ